MTYAEWLIERYQRRGLMLDSNLLLLHLVGTVNISLVGNGDYNKLSEFTVQQIFVLQRLVALFKRVVTTAHVLTEVSNLVNDLQGARKEQIFSFFISMLEVIQEQEISSYQAARRREFRYLGLTGSVLAEMSSQFLVVSNDGRMVNVFREKGIEALKWVEVLGLSA